MILFCAMLAGLVMVQDFSRHPWKGKRVAYFGDSITDPGNDGSKKKYWGFLEDWLGITPYVYGVSGRQWNDIPRQAQKLQEEHGGRNRCRTQNPPRAARIAIKNSHILD